MATTLPTPEQVETFKAAWALADQQGLTGLRTHFALAAVLSMPAPTPPVTLLQDREGDLWQLDEDGLWRCLPHPDLAPRGLESLTGTWGPMK